MRPIHGVLHSYQESRELYLDKGGEAERKDRSGKNGKEDTKDENEETIKHHQRTHLVYMIFFHSAAKRAAGAFFSLVTDTFWGLEYDIHHFMTRYNLSKNIVGSYTGIAKLMRGGNGDKLKHLTLTKRVNAYDLRHFSVAFPCLETLTIVIQEEYMMLSWGDDSNRLPLTYRPEINGQLNATGLTADQRSVLTRMLHVVPLHSTRSLRLTYFYGGVFMSTDVDAFRAIQNKAVSNNVYTNLSGIPTSIIEGLQHLVFAHNAATPLKKSHFEHVCKSPEANGELDASRLSVERRRAIDDANLKTASKDHSSQDSIDLYLLRDFGLAHLRQNKKQCTKKSARQTKALTRKEASARDIKTVAKEAEVLTKEARGTLALQMMHDIPKRRTRISIRNPLTEFLLFPKLPIELRLMVWALAAPEPATVAQRKSRVKGRDFYYLRPGGVPALLHACKESRYEYLEEDTNDKDAKAEIESRRRKHPVYKLFFRKYSKTSAGAYMSVDVDTFWAMHFEFEAASSVKHLAVTYSDFSRVALWSFESLESLTVLVEEKELLERFGGPITYPAEVDSQMTQLSDMNLAIIVSGRQFVMGLTMSIIHGENTKFGSLPLKWRYERQFIRAENLRIPEIEDGPKNAGASKATTLRLRR
ncbi:uncharacterized protein PAC_02461 [Phialocephala subalpina]|uniref:2EXR domain-containing protein n=1 Tax=Phialocephala subalpina TaxID=576137 RepID=A0A1L7WII8_9HELO|nr:uncharacterized protein PAC_02461 [Phialocephala subalpina]